MRGVVRAGFRDYGDVLATRLVRTVEGPAGSRSWGLITLWSRVWTHRKTGGGRIPCRLPQSGHKDVP